MTGEHQKIRSLGIKSRVGNENALAMLSGLKTAGGSVCGLFHPVRGSLLLSFIITESGRS